MKDTDAMEIHMLARLWEKFNLRLPLRLGKGCPFLLPEISGKLPLVESRPAPARTGKYNAEH